MAEFLNPKNIDITNPAHLAKIIDEIEGDQNRRRRQEAWKTFQCLEGNQEEYIKNRLIEVYPKTFSKFRIGNINIPKKIVDKKNKAYKTAPIRSLENKKENEELERIYKDYKFSRAFKEADRLFNAHKYVAAWLTYINPEENSDALEGMYKLQSLAPYEYDLIKCNETHKPLIFILNYPDNTITRNADGADGAEQTITESQSDTSAESKIYTFFNANFMVKVRAIIPKLRTARDIRIEKIKEEPNLIGRLPCAFISQDEAYDYPVRSSLANRSIEWNVAFSDLKTAASAQGHGQLVISHPQGQKIKDAHMGMHVSLNLPQSRKDVESGITTDAKYISASPDLTGQLDVLKFDIANILDDEGIKPKGSIQGTTESFNSGFERLVSEADVQDIIQDNQSIYAECLEPEIYDILKSYEEALNKNTFKSETISVNFEKPKVLISDKETLDNIEKRDQLGTLLSYEKHMMLNPNLSEEEAKAREAAIQAEKKERAAEMAAMFENENSPEDDTEDEDESKIGEGEGDQ